MSIKELLVPSACIVETGAPPRDELLKRMVEALASAAHLGVSTPRGVLKELIRREAAASTAFGLGVAVPHCFLLGLGAPRLAIASCRGGVDFHAMDGGITLVVFLLLEDSRGRMQHNAVLARIARLCRDTALVSRIAGATEPASFASILAEEEEQLG